MCGPTHSEVQIELDRSFDRLRSESPVGQIAQRIAAGKITAEQVCRTCSLDANHLHGLGDLTVRVLLAARKAGTVAEFLAAQGPSSPDPVITALLSIATEADPSLSMRAAVQAAGCQPDAEAEIKRLLVDRSMVDLHADAGVIQRRSVPDASGAVKVELTTKPERRTVALIESCGQDILPKCRRCGNFAAITVPVQGGLNANDRPWFRDVVVGGHCKLVDHCHPVPLPRDSSNANGCHNCGNMQVFGNNWQIDHGTVVRVDLTAYEMDQARRHADVDEEGRPQIGRAIAAARRLMGTIAWPKGPNTSVSTPIAPGVLKTYAGELMSVDTCSAVRQINQIRVGDGSVGTMLPDHRAALSIELGTRVLHSLLHRQQIGYVVRREPKTRNFVAAESSAWATWGRFLHQDRCAFTLAFARSFDPNFTELAFDPVTVPPISVRHTDIRSVQVRFAGGTVVVVDPLTGDALDASGQRRTHGVIDSLRVRDNRAVVQVMTPHTRDLGLPDVSVRWVRLLPRTTPCPACAELERPSRECTSCGGTGSYHALPARMARTVVPAEDDCPRCDAQHGACAFHARAPRSDIDPVTGERVVTFTRPDRPHRNRDASPGRLLHFDGQRVVNEQGEDPDIWIFRAWLSGLLRRYPAHAQIIQAQYDQGYLHLASGRAMLHAPGFLAPLHVQPWVPYCTANLADPTIGLDLRDELGDHWGDPRSAQSTNPMHRVVPTPTKPGDPYFSRTKAAAFDEWVRVTNPGERLQEEFLKSLHHFTQMAKGRYAPMAEPAAWRVTQYDPLGVEGGDGTTADKMVELDRPRRVEIPDPDGGPSTVFWASGRWVEFGYENFRSGAQLSATDIADVLALRPVEDDDERFVGYVCCRCGARYAVDEAKDRDFTCTETAAVDQDDPDAQPDQCAGAIIWIETKRTAEDRAGNLETTSDHIEADEPYRRKGSPQLATAPDTARWQQTEMLMSLGHGCAHWRPRFGRYDAARGSSRIQLPSVVPFADLLGHTVEVMVDGQTYRMPVTSDTIHRPVLAAYVESGGASIVSFPEPGYKSSRSVTAHIQVVD